MSKTYDVSAIAEAVGYGTTTVWIHRADASCPLHGAGMFRPRGGRKLLATRETLKAYKRWLREPAPAEPAAQTTGAA